MSNDTEIQPALTANQWDEFKRGGGLPITWYPCGGGIPQLGINGPELMAISNAALPADDPRKITHRMLDEIEDAIDEYAGPYTPAIKRAAIHIAGLRAFLPPR